ncbi:hypothetical protein [Burkholderia pseudomallei]|uniref:hypothetical protein n=1 Tax=Burkholderia pseudomallei TaxID=28450 RepID=UPI000531E9A4|nr:hypothetical protein [Burkholderia pseudomallei]KGS21609.1 hypothetical protein X941_5543 [Burkholderia pseudomallei MSHR5569]
MFDKGEGLNSEVKFAVAATYDKFSQRWDLLVDKLKWVDMWAQLLGNFSVEEINTAADYCVAEFRRPPVPVEMRILAERVRSGKPLSDPIVSKLERMAYLILFSDEFRNMEISYSELSDACLIVAAIAHRKAYGELDTKVDPSFLTSELSSRAQMFAEEAENWERDATEGKGYWVEAFNPKRAI